MTFALSVCRSWSQKKPPCRFTQGVLEQREQAATHHRSAPSSSHRANVVIYVCVCVCLSAVFPHCRPCFFCGPFRPGQHRRVLDGGRALLASAVPVRGVRAATRQSRRAEPHHGQPAQIQLHRTCGGGRIRLWISCRSSGTTSCIEGLFFFAPSESSSSPPSVRMEGWR